MTAICAARGLRDSPSPRKTQEPDLELALAELPEDEEFAIRASYGIGLGPLYDEEIADCLGIGVYEVWLLLSRGLEMLGFLVATGSSGADRLCSAYVELP